MTHYIDGSLLALFATHGATFRSPHQSLLKLLDQVALLTDRVPILANLFHKYLLFQKMKLEVLLMTLFRFFESLDLVLFVHQIGGIASFLVLEGLFFNLIRHSARFLILLKLLFELFFLLGECSLFLNVGLLGKLRLHGVLLVQVLVALILQLLEVLDLVFLGL